MTHGRTPRVMPLATLTGGSQPPILPPKLAPSFAGEEPEPEPIPTAPGSLVLSEERLEWLVQLALLRIQEVSEELGRSPDGSIRPDSWMDELDRNAKSYRKELDWRAQMAGTIFAEGMNLTWGASSARVRLLSARVRDTLMGTRPFFGCMTARNGNSDLTKAAESYLQDRIDKTNVAGSIRGGIRTALAINHAVIKTTFKSDHTPFVGPARGVFVDAFGNPVRTSKGELVYDKDDVIPDPSVQGLLRLKKDPSFSFEPGQYDSKDFESLEQELVHYEGADSKVVDYRDFLCPLDVESVHDADINVHLYHRTLGQLGLAYSEVEASRIYFSTQLDKRVGAEQPIRIRGEDDKIGTRTIPKIFVAECYLRCQIHDDQNDPREYEIMMVLDVDNQKAIFYDYLGNHMSKRPFAVIPGVQKVDGRWYGLGVFSMMAHPDLFTDAMLNRVNQKASRAASATFYFKNASPLWKDGTPPSLGTNEMVPLDMNWDPAKPPIFRTNLLENAELDMQVSGDMRRAADNEFGIQSAAAASELDQNRSNTATGVNSIERDANLISKDNMSDVARAIEEVLWQAVEMELEHMDETVVAFSPDGSQLATLDREEIRSLDKQVRLLLTKSRTSEGIAVMNQGEAVAMRYWNLSPPQRKALRPLYVNQLRFLEIDDSDELLPEVSDEEIAAWQQQQANQKPADKPVSESIAFKASDLTYDERAQALAKAGIKASPPNDLAAKQAADTAAEVTVKQAAPPHPFPENKSNSPNPK